MIPNRIFVALLFTLFSCNEKPLGTVSEEKEVPPHKVSRLATPIEGVLRKAKITKGDVFKPEEFRIDLEGLIITADTHGNLASGKLTRSIDLGMDFYTRSMHFLDNGRQVVIFFEVTDDEGSYNEVYSLDKGSLETVWKTRLLSFNLTVGQSEHETLFLGAGENAYALNLKTGKVDWQADGLYHIYGFNYFDSIAIDGDEIRLTGKSYSKGEGETVKTATLSKKDGTVLTVK